MSEWTVRVNGADQASVKPGERMEIGRKPLRPLADDGNRRLDVVDSTKSMSKRHALFEVKPGGSAIITDLSSTNGSYVVRDNGDLLRLPPDTEFMLPTSPMRMQFGDVPVDFVMVEDDDTADDQPVANLFGYAVNEPSPEPDAADMSVDDILDLRAGEPTTMFRASNVKRKVDSLDMEPLAIVQPVTEPEEPAKPRDLFVDAMAQQNADELAEADRAHAELAAQVAPSAQPVQDTQGGQRTQRPDSPAGDPVRSAMHDVVPVEAIAHAVVRPVEPAQVEQIQQPVAMVADAAAAVAPEALADAPSEADVAELAVAESNATEPAAAEAAESNEQVDATQSAQSAADDESAADKTIAVETSANVAAVQTQDNANAGDYTPAFEAGSVFERVAKGEFKAAEEVIEIDGLNSTDAKTTQDFSTQFEMARHPELLAFLAMNPYLYDDLYAWLAARGERDIDEALAHNSGYQEYREAVGK
ncbi:FHA domain-containing protein [Bifidobacterium oedipodis]|uniref:Forkhead-associated protein n=1 Tax=Bifidobacterium oedipodis TaxID=2675322 RepID=A0A7Y0ERH0_9BIFI|nr:Forkhead-associated protein [Bifidobacterium sp. DSM 109957]